VSKPDLKVVTLQASNFRDVPGTLRVIADQIEAGDYGGVTEAVVALMGRRLEVFGLGQSDGATSTTLLAAAQLRLVREVERHDDGEPEDAKEPA
jgi:hypothetical protein